MATLNQVTPKPRHRTGSEVVKKLKQTSNTLGPFATRVLRQIKARLEPEPKLHANSMRELSNDWVLWFMRTTGCARVVAVTRGYQLLEDKAFRIDRNTYPLGFEKDKGLLVLGVERTKDYFYHNKRAKSLVDNHY